MKLSHDASIDGAVLMVPVLMVPVLTVPVLTVPILMGPVLMVPVWMAINDSDTKKCNSPLILRAESKIILAFKSRCEHFKFGDCTFDFVQYVVLLVIHTYIQWNPS